MKVTPVPLGFDLMTAAPGYVRGEGLHLSTIYNSYYQEAEPDRYTGGPMDVPRVGLGLAFEEKVEQILRAQLGDGVIRPGELVDPEHGILMSPDLVLFNGHTRLTELKLTWLSCREWPQSPSNGFPQKADKYVTQMACYCRVLETPYAALIGYFVNGDWDRAKMAPQLLRWDIEFSKREMDDEWATMICHARQRKLL